jgi:hypothetical protein
MFLGGIDRFGAFDYAVPEHWLMQDPEKNRPHVWFYPRGNKPGRIFGRPLKWMAAARLGLREMRKAGIPEIEKWLRLWAYVYPGRGLDADGIAAFKRFLAENPWANSRRDTVASIIGYYEIPAPPPGTFEAAPCQAA